MTEVSTEEIPITASTTENSDEAAFRVSNTLNLSVIALVANIGSLLFGYEIGSTSFLLTSIKLFADADEGAFYSYVADNAVLTGCVVSGASLGAVITYPFLLFHANEMSKKDEILLAAFFFFMGAMCESFSGYFNWDYCYGLVLLLIGRVVYGAGIACSFHAIPQYVIETVPLEGRGQFGSATEAMVMTGMTFGFGVGYLYSGDGWVLTYLVAYLVAVLMGVFSLFLPNSATWLLEHHYLDEEVLHALLFIYPLAEKGTVDVLRRRFAADRARREELEARCRLNNDSYAEKIVLFKLGIHEKSSPELMLLMLDRTLRRSLLLCLFLQSMSVVSGQLPLIYYASDIFETIYPSSVQTCILGFILVKTAVSFVMIFSGEACGRRQFYLASTAGMSAALLLACVSFLMNWSAACITGLYLFAFCFEFACGTLVWIVVNELFPHYIRSTANAVSVCLQFAVFFAVTLLLPLLEGVIGFAYLFLIFAAVNLGALYCVYVYLPETQGVQLEQAYLLVDEKFDNASSSACCTTAKDDERSADSELERSGVEDGRDEADPLMGNKY